MLFWKDNTIRSLLLAPALMAAGLLCTACARADGIDDLVQARMKAEQIPGLSLIVVKDGKVLKRAAYGVASIELQTPSTADDRYDTGSIGKTFTSAVVMSLVEEGKLSLEDPITKFFTDAPDTWKGIKIKNLLSHTSGLKEHALMQGLLLTDTYTPEQWFQRMYKEPLDFPTGSMFAYSNSNFYLLPLIVEKVTGKHWDDIVREKIFDPLGMRNTEYLHELVIYPRKAAGYLLNGNDLIVSPQFSESSGHGSGGILSCVDDFVKYAEGLAAGKVVKPETLKQMQTAFRFENGRKSLYGLGWFVRDVNGHRMISHAGNSLGYSASLCTFPDDHLIVVLMCNLYPVDGDGFARQIAEQFVPELKPEVFKEAPDPDAKFTRQLLEVLQSLARGESNSPMLDENMRARLATPRGQMGLQGLRGLSGVTELRFLQIRPDDPDQLYIYRAQAGGRSWIVTFAVTKEKKVFSVGARPE